jgi:hypothetical protein
MKVKVTDKVTAEGRAFQKEIAQLKKLQVRVGFQQGKAQEDDGTDIADIAAWNELGTSTIPARPFMADSVDKHQDEINKFCKERMKRFSSGAEDAETVLKLCGNFQVGAIQKEIVDGDFAPNAESTIRKKGSDKPLIDTGRMRQSVHFVIVEK